MIKVLLNTYSPRIASSYGVICRDLWTRLARTGRFQILQMAWYHREILDPVSWRLITTKTVEGANGVPNGWPKDDQWGQQSLEGLIRQFRPDIVWNLGDMYMFPTVEALSRTYGFKTVYWTVEAGAPMDEATLPLIDRADLCVAQAPFAASLWEKHLGRKFPVLSPGVDTEIFTVVPPEEKARLRRVHGAGKIRPEDFLILYVGRNQERKRPWLPIQIAHYLKTGEYGPASFGHVTNPWDPVLQKHPRVRGKSEPIPVKLWIHSNQDGKYDYAKLCRHWGLTMGEDVFFTKGLNDASGLDAQDVAKIYQMADVVSMVSGAEGFGMPIIEAAACGVPSVVTDYSGCGEIGRLCDSEMVAVDSFHHSTGPHACIANPSLIEAINAFQNLCNDSWRKGPTVQAALRARATSQFDWDKIALNWLELLLTIHEKPRALRLGVVV